MVLGKLRMPGVPEDEPQSIFSPEDPLTFRELLEVQRTRFGQKVLLQTKTRRERRPAVQRLAGERVVGEMSQNVVQVG